MPCHSASPGHANGSECGSNGYGPEAADTRDLPVHHLPWYLILLVGGTTSSPTWSFTTAGPPGAVTLISPANTPGGVSTSPTLRWGSVEGAQTYAVYFGTSASPPLANNFVSLRRNPG